MVASGTQPGGNEGTHFAPAQRAEPADLEADIARTCDNPVVDAVLQAFGGVVMILNEQRQILAVNATVLKLLGVDDPESVLGSRPGEALACIQVDEAPGGCGTGLACRSCGAVISILASARGDDPVERDCLLTSRLGGGELALEFKARATPLTIDGHPFTVLTLQSISDERRHQALQRLFFHDISNLLTALQGTCDTLTDTDPDELRALMIGIKRMTARIVEDVTARHDLQRIEAGEYEPKPVATSAEAILEELRRAFRGHRLMNRRTLDLPRGGLALPLHTDPTLVQRVLRSLIENALEATPAGGVVRCWSEGWDNGVTFKVHNASTVPPEVGLRIFQRSFSTKGVGHGLGTYSAKLITQRCLGGRISFSSSAEGTTFSIRLPRD